MDRKIAVCLLLTLLVAAPVFAQSEHPQSEHPMDPAAMQEAWMKAATPGEFHAFLAARAGRWQVAGKMWMAPDAEPELSESTVEAEMILGGRYFLEKMHGTAMGMPFDGLSILGYDNSTGVVTAVWMDTMGTMTLVMTGKWEKPGAPLVTAGTYLDPATGQETAVRAVTTFVGADESRFEYFSAAAGMPEAKSMELHYTRMK